MKNKGKAFGNFLRKIFVNNIVLKLLALLAAVVIWLLVGYLFV
ncbi:MAG: hypothetical protein RR248_04685 [Clostridia bacterium]